jgi:hypothetical protein
MNTTCPDLLAALHTRMRDLELEACDTKARILELRDVIDRLEHPQRKRGRPPGQRRVEVVHDATPALFTHNDDDNGGTAA